MRSGGFAEKAAQLFESVLSHVNRTHGLGQHPLTIRTVLSFMEQGKAIMAECASSAEDKTLACAAVELGKRAGGACTQPVLGILGRQNEVGKVPAKRLAALTAASVSNVKAGKKRVEANDLGTFGNLARTESHWKIRKEGPDGSEEVRAGSRAEGAVKEPVVRKGLPNAEDQIKRRLLLGELPTSCCAD
jgi:hypothetical protein